MTDHAAAVETVRRLLVKYWPYSDRMALEVLKLLDAAVRAEQDRHARAIADRDGHGRCHACIELVRARREGRCGK